MKSGEKGGGTTNLSNHLKRNHQAENKEIKLTLGESENSNKNAPNLNQANNSVNQYFTI